MKRGCPVIDTGAAPFFLQETHRKAAAVLSRQPLSLQVVKEKCDICNRKMTVISFPQLLNFHGIFSVEAGTAQGKIPYHGL